MSDSRDNALPVGSDVLRGVGLWAIIGLIATEATLFAYLLFAYAFTYVQDGPAWGPSSPPDLRLAGPGAIVLLVSCLAVWWGADGVQRGKQKTLLWGFGAATLLALAFVALQALEWRSKSFSLQSSGYGSYFFTIIGVHLAHIIAGLIALIAIFGWGARKYFDESRNAAVTYVALYWYFVGLSWLAVFLTLYVIPRVV